MNINLILCCMWKEEGKALPNPFILSVPAKPLPVSATSLK